MTQENPLRDIFNGAAQDYNAIRPGYPRQVFDDIITLSGIPENGQALEIGCGTGQATHPFAKLGYAIQCLDIGPALLAIAAENLHDYPNVRFANESFESWQEQAEQFDLIYAATAFHWIPRDIGYPKAARLLKPGGALAVFWNRHPRPFSGFFEDVQPLYQTYAPEIGDPRALPSTEAETAELAEYIRASRLFAGVEVRTYPWSISYTTVEYLRLLNTYSGNRAMDAERRQGLYGGIAHLIDSQYGGRIEHPYLTVLYVAKKDNP